MQAEPIDVREMAIIHRLFRDGYAESAQLVRASPAPSPERVTFLADHIDFGLTALHHHHEAEDALFYPVLIKRVPDQAEMLQNVDEEHLAIKTALDAASAASAAWRERPSAETGEALAAALDNLNSVAQPHLDDEEQKGMPVAAVTFTQREWDNFGKAAGAWIPNNKKVIAFGLLTEMLGEADLAHMRRQLPAVVRMLSPWLIERPWKKYATTLRTGT
jgi:hemerythrin-like domain-containing protein